jgi:outer membrane protein
VTALVGLALAAAFQTAQTAPVLTLEEAVSLAEQNAFSVRIAQTRVERQRQVLNEARASQGPKLNAVGTYQRFGDETRQGDFVVQSIDSTTVNLSVSMPLDITGVISRGISGAQAFVRAAMATASAEKNTARLSARTSYFNVLRASALVAVSRQAVENAQEQLRIEKIREQEGVSAQVDVLRFETQLAQARSELITAENQLVLAKQALNNLLARPIQTPFQVVEPPVLPTSMQGEDALTETAIENRPEIKAIREQRQGLALQRRATEGGLYPSLSVSATHSRNLDPLPTQREETTVGTLQVNWPIFDSGLTRARVRQVRQDEEQAALQQQQIELAISLEVRQAVANLQNAVSRLAVADSQVQFASETYRLARVRLEAGEGTSLEVTQAQTELTRAQTQQANARFDVRTAFAQLQRAVGADEMSASAQAEGRK